MPPRFSWWELRNKQADHEHRQPMLLTEHPTDTNHIQGLAQFDRKLTEAVDCINTEQRKMASPSYAADRLKALRQKIMDESDKLVSAIDGVENKDMPEAFAHGHAFLKAQQADVQALKDELAQLSNLGPLDPAQPTASSDSKPSQ